MYLLLIHRSLLKCIVVYFPGENGKAAATGQRYGCPHGGVHPRRHVELLLGLVLHRGNFTAGSLCLAAAWMLLLHFYLRGQCPPLCCSVACSAAAARTRTRKCVNLSNSIVFRNVKDRYTLIYNKKVRFLQETRSRLYPNSLFMNNIFFSFLNLLSFILIESWYLQIKIFVGEYLLFSVLFVNL